MNHREAWAEEEMSPTKAQAEANEYQAGPSKPKRNSSNEILVVSSKVKAYIKSKWGLNTSASAMEALSDKMRESALKAIEVARKNGRKTVLDRDVNIWDK